jgi:solute carrier family 35 protein E1
VYTVALSRVFLCERASARVVLSLVPIIAGVAISAASELDFALAALLGAVLFDLAFALRNVASKRAMAGADPSSPRLSPVDLFGLLTIISAVCLTPLALALEGRALPSVWAAATARIPLRTLLWQILLAGGCFYGYSEVAMQALSNVSPVTHAIANTMRHVVVMLVSAAVFATPMTTRGKLGAALAVGGSYLYSMAASADKARKARAEVDMRAAEREVALAYAVAAAARGSPPAECADEARLATGISPERLREIAVSYAWKVPLGYDFEI